MSGVALWVTSEEGPYGKRIQSGRGQHRQDMWVGKLLMFQKQGTVPCTPLFTPKRFVECLSPNGDQSFEKLVCEDWKGGGQIILVWKMGSLRITQAMGPSKDSGQSWE